MKSIAGNEKDCVDMLAGNFLLGSLQALGWQSLLKFAKRTSMVNAFYDVGLPAIYVRSALIRQPNMK